jgi:hypothetical protein
MIAERRCGAPFHFDGIRFSKRSGQSASQALESLRCGLGLGLLS